MAADDCDLECGDRFFNGAGTCRHGRTAVQAIASIAGTPTSSTDIPTSSNQMLLQVQGMMAQLKAAQGWKAFRDKGRLLINNLVAEESILVVDPREAFAGEIGDLEDPRPAVVMTQGCYDRSVAILMEGTTDTKDDVTRDLVAYFIWLGVQEGLVL